MALQTIKNDLLFKVVPKLVDFTDYTLRSGIIGQYVREIGDRSSVYVDGMLKEASVYDKFAYTLKSAHQTLSSWFPAIMKKVPNATQNLLQNVNPDNVLTTLAYGGAIATLVITADGIHKRIKG
jgi:hypothetical protein